MDATSGTYSGGISDTLNKAWETVSVAAKDNPYWAAAVGTLTLCGTAALGYKLVFSNSTDPETQAKIERQNRTKDVLSKLGITEYNLPSSSGEQSQLTNNTNTPRPIFQKGTVQEIAVVVKMIEKATQHKSPLPNLILAGPPGVGKTMLGEELCNQTGIGFIRIPSGTMEKQIKNGNHISAFRDIVSIAEDSPVPTYLIMDDGEELIAKRAELNNVENTDKASQASWNVEHQRLSETITQRRTALVNATLEESGKAYRKVGFCITTNRPQVIDGAFMTRCKVITIVAPNMEERKQIIITHLPTTFKNDNDVLSFFHKGRLEDMATKTEGFTGRNIVKMLEDIYGCVQLENGNITQDTVDASIISTREAVQKDSSKGPSILQNVRQLWKSVLVAMAG